MINPTDTKLFLELLFEKRFGMILVLVIVTILIVVLQGYIFNPAGSSSTTYLYIGSTTPDGH